MKSPFECPSPVVVLVVVVPRLGVGAEVLAVRGDQRRRPEVGAGRQARQERQERLLRFVHAPARVKAARRRGVFPCGCLLADSLGCTARPAGSGRNACFASCRLLQGSRGCSQSAFLSPSGFRAGQNPAAAAKVSPPCTGHLHGDSGGMEIGGNRSQMCTINAVLTHPNVYVDDTPVQR